MVLKIVLSKYRILIMAIGLSLILHCFWLSVVKVIVAPENTRAVKFSKVSFLGPILTRMATEVRVSPRARSFLEDRYNTIAQNTTKRQSVPVAGAYLKDDSSKSSSVPVNYKLVWLIDNAVSDRKLEPAPNDE